ncbi:MAG TPA: hypothetical protein VGE21_05100 [Flavobacteriales bacterium]
MRTLASLLLLLGLTAQISAQVQVDRPMVLNAAEAEHRRIQGLGPATAEDELITLGAARNATYHWASTGGTANAITLAMDPPCTGYATGLAVRFRAQAPAVGAVTVNVDGLGPKRLLRNDGLGIPFGQVRAGSVVEALYTDTAFILMDRAVEGCPAGFLRANDRLCVMRNDTLNMSIFNASSWCMDRGARLCTWDEYIHLCTVLVPGGQFLDHADNWEWIDDTHDHTHSAAQAGRWNCNSIRNLGALENANNHGSVRCCYHPR